MSSSTPGVLKRFSIGVDDFRDMYCSAMAINIPGDFGQLTIIHTVTGDIEPMVVTMGIGGNDSDVTEWDNLAAQVAIDWAQHVMSHMPAQLTLTGVEIAYHLTGEDETDPFHIAFATASDAGEETGTSVPQNTALLLHKRTAVAGRQGRGRIYLPCVLESVVNNVGVVDPSYRTTMTDALNDFQADVELVGDNGLWLFHSPVGAELVGKAPTRITAWECDAVCATQRRRLR